jgi:hypothetical protein
MVAPSNANTIRSYVVEVPVEPYAGRLHETRRRREMLPWADPYIAGLVQRLKHEIEAERAERRRQPLRDTTSPLNNEANPPLHNGNLDFEQPDRDAWPSPDEIY